MTVTNCFITLDLRVYTALCESLWVGFTITCNVMQNNAKLCKTKQGPLAENASNTRRYTGQVVHDKRSNIISTIFI